MPRKNEPTERTCILTRTTRPTSELLRFVLDPESRVVPDLKGDLPGRGVWVTASRAAVDAAEKKRLFGRGFKAEVTVEPGLGALVDRLLEARALGALGLARKAGTVVTGFAKVESAAGRPGLVAAIAASDGAEDGIRKIRAALRRRAGMTPGPPVVRAFTSAQLDLALGGGNVVHAALLAGRPSEIALERTRELEAFRGGPLPTGEVDDGTDDRPGEDDSDASGGDAAESRDA